MKNLQRAGVCNRSLQYFPGELTQQSDSSLHRPCSSTLQEWSFPWGLPLKPMFSNPGQWNNPTSVFSWQAIFCHWAGSYSKGLLSISRTSGFYGLYLGDILSTYQDFSQSSQLGEDSTNSDTDFSFDYKSYARSSKDGCTGILRLAKATGFLHTENKSVSTTLHIRSK